MQNRDKKEVQHRIYGYHNQTCSRCQIDLIPHGQKSRKLPSEKKRQNADNLPQQILVIDCTNNRILMGQKCAEISGTDHNHDKAEDHPGRSCQKNIQ